MLLAADLRLRFEFADAGGSPLSSLSVGDDFLLRAYVKDIRGAGAEGVFQAYFDLTYNSGLISPTASIDHTGPYNHFTSGDTLSSGLINEVGGMDADQVAPSPRDAELLLFSVPFQADTSGTLTLTGNTADRSILFFDTVVALPLSRISFVDTSIPIVEQTGPKVSIAATTQGNESGPVNGRFTVSQTEANSSDTVLSYTVAGTATSGSDYTALSGSVTIPAGSTSATIDVPVIDDAIVEAVETVTVSLTGITSGAPDVAIDTSSDEATLQITDNDIAGITVQPTTGQTTEAGGTATFEIVLNSRPTADVTIGLASSDPDEGTVSPAGVTFTAANWNVPQTVTVTGQDDDVVDGDTAYTIVTEAAVSSDPVYGGFAVADVSITNVDNDSAGITVTPTTGQTSESGDTATFTIALTSRPTADVTIALSSSDTSEGTVSPSSITITPATWNVPRTVTITGQDDDLVDGNVAYTIVTAPATSSDPNYQDLNAADVSVTNRDNEAPGVTISPPSGPTTEAGGTATFSVVLNARPTADVSIALSSSDTTEGTVSANLVTFTPANWNVPQTITATGQDDDRADGDVSYTIITGATTSSDPSYAGLSVADIALTNLDDDSAGIVVTALNGLQTTESGGMTALSIQLTSEPASNVVINVSSSDTSEGTLTPTQLTFTSVNWDQPQVVTVQGQDDPQVDGNVSYTVVTAPAISSDAAYNGLDAEDLTLTNLDNDEPGFLIAAQEPIITSESGQTATFTVVLVSQPTAAVNVDLTSSDTGEGAVQPATLLFSMANWDVPQTVTLSGVDDQEVDGDVSYRVTAQTRSSDPNFDGLTTDDLQAVNTDDDTPAVLVSPITGLATSEAGATATFQVVLNAPPTADVTVPIASSDTTEGTVSVHSLVFTPANWSSAQIVTVIGVDDDLSDGDVAYSVIVSAATSADSNYDGFDPPDVALVNLDNDTPGIRVSPSTGTTTEAGGTATFSMVLSSRPTADVVIGLSSSDSSEGVASASQVRFTSANWNVPQTITVTGQDDHRIDGDVAYTIVTAPAASADPGYAGLDAADLALTNVDDDEAGIVVTPLNGLETTESGGMTVLSIVLTSEPSADVVVDVSSSDTSEGTLSPVRLTFTPVNWDQAQVVVVQGQDDPQVDGDVDYTIVTAPATSGDPDYHGIDAADITLTNLDNDEAGFEIAAQLPLTTSESGQTATFTVVLASQPTATVTIDFSSSDPGEGTLQGATVVFSTANWNVPQTVTVSGVDDADVDGDISYQINAESSSSDPNFDGLTASAIQAINLDDDAPAILVSPVAGLTTSESGGSATFEVVLNAPPASDVTVPIASGDTTEGTVSVASLVFTASNWSTPQTVTVTGVDDDLSDGDTEYTVTVLAATSSDTQYNGFDPPDVTLTNLDNDAPGIRVTPTTGTTTEAGSTATFSVVLESRPAADVVIDLSSSDPSEGVASVSRLAFTPATWNVPQTVAVTGQDDHRVDGDVAYTIVTAPAVSDDPDYAGMNAADVSLTNLDNDSAGIVVTALNGLETTEGGGMTSLSIVLTSEPTADVVIDVSSSDTSEGTLSPVRLTFTSANWNDAQIVVVQGQDDPQVDGDITYTVVTAPAISSDPDYDGMDADDLTLTNLDDDEAGFEIAAELPLTTSESGQTATFTVVLVSQPTAAVNIDFSSSDTGEGTVDPATLMFTAANWNVPQTVTVTGVDDQEVDGAVQYHITAESRSTDANFDGLISDDLEAVNLDDDTPAVLVSPVAGLTTSEAGASATFQVVLNVAPTADVTVAVASSDPTEGALLIESLVFTPTNWATPQTVTVTGVDDDTVDGDIDYSVVLSPATSGDSAYNGLDPSDVALTNLDDDTPGIRMTPVEGSATTEAGGTVDFSVVLNSRPTADVTINWTTSDETEGTVATSSFTFTPENWNVPQVLTVQGVGDSVVDGDVQYAVVATASSSDSHYGSLEPVEAALTNEDDDLATITVSAANLVVSEGTGGSNTLATFDVTLSGVVEGGFDFNYLLEDETATAAGGDYLGTGGSVSFAGTDGETHSVTIEINPDNIVEPDETFRVVAAAISGISASAAERISTEGSPLVFTILDDDEFTISFSGVSQPEGTGNGNTPFDFEVTLSNPVQGGLQIVYTTSDGTATVADSDYLDNDGVLEFTDSQTQVIRVEVPQDATVERDETFTVSLDEIIFLDTALAEIFDVEGGTRTGTILNDDTATVSFVDASSVALETGGTHEVELRLSVANGGTLSEDVIVDLAVDASSTALDADDYVLSDTSVTFPAGSADGEIRRVTITPVADDIDEDDESIRLGLAVAGDGIGGAVSAASPDEHVVTLTEDPMTASVSGHVWFDANNNGVREEGELGIPGVTVTLTGSDLRGQTVEIVVMTDDEGAYHIEHLPAGTYSVQETQPEAFVDGIDVLGTINGEPWGTAGNDLFSGIVLAPEQQAVDYSFGERSLTRTPVSLRFFLASTPPLQESIREVVARAEEIAGDLPRAAAIRRGEAPEMRRIGSQVTLLGTGGSDEFSFAPAGNSNSPGAGEHLVVANGIRWTFDSEEVHRFTLNGSSGDDLLKLHDSPSDDVLEAEGNRLTLTDGDFWLEAIAFEQVRATSSAGGQDRVQQQAIDFVLQLEGPWIS